MTTRMKFFAAASALLILAGCTAAAQDQTAKTGFGPGACPRYEQMVQARADGDIPFGPPAGRNCGAGYGRGMQAGFGPGMGPGMGMGMGMRAGYGPPVNADGTIDTAQLPDWCPYKQSVTPPATETQSPK